MRISNYPGAALLLTACAAFAQASTVHKWIDADGVTHYSDAAPPASVTGFERIELPAVPALDPELTSDYYSIANQWQRVHRERIELERMRAERARELADRRTAVTRVILAPESRRSVVVLPRLRPRWPPSKPAAVPARRHPLAIPGRDWPVGLHPGRHDLRGSFPTQ